MKLSKILKRLTPAVAAFMIAFAVVGTAHAIPYSGDSTPPTSGPQFNAFTGVPSEGDESDFFRGKVVGDTNPSTNVVNSTCETGKKFQLRVYVHNGATESLNNNGTGPSVAKNTKVKVDLKNASAASQFNPDASISASNAATVTDGMTIKCTDGKTVKLSYIAGSAAQFTRTGSKPLSDNIVTTGAAVGTDQPDGNVWGCWTQRVYVTLQVEVKEVEKPKVGDGSCKASELTVLDKDARKIRVTVTGQLTGEGASIVGYRINWGDGSAVATTQTAEHTYAADGTYTVTSEVRVRMPDGSEKWVNGGQCTKQVTFKKDVPPQVITVTTTSLPKTGAGDMLGIFTATSAAGVFLHRKWLSRRSQ